MYFFLGLRRCISKVHDAVWSLALCHNVTPVFDNNNSSSNGNSSSPTQDTTLLDQHHISTGRSMSLTTKCSLEFSYSRGVYYRTLAGKSELLPGAVTATYSTKSIRCVAVRWTHHFFVDFKDKRHSNVTANKALE